MRMAIVVGAALALSGCGGTMLLKSPVAEQCRSAGLKSCEDLSEGVAAYVGGDKDAGKRRISSAAGGNDPAQITAFAAKLRTVAALPGLSGFAPELAEVAAMLEGGAKGAPAGNGGGTSASPRAAPVEAGRTETAIASGHAKAYECEPFGRAHGTFMSSTCLKLGVGPLVVSDVIATGSCAFELSLLSGNVDAPAWAIVVSPKERLATHGARLFVAPYEELVVALRTTSALPRDASCGLTVTTLSP